MPAEESRNAELSATALWREILDEQVQILPRSVAQNLRGTLQFVIDMPDTSSLRFYIHSDGRSLALRHGDAPTSNARVVSTDAEVRAMLANPEPPKGALRVSGDYDFFVAVFRALSAQPKPTSLLSLRGQR